MLLSASCKKEGLSLLHILLYTGIGAGVASAITTPFMSNNRVISNPAVLSTYDWCALFGLSLFMNLKTIFIIFALKISPHVLVTSVRTMEIVIVLAIEMLIFHSTPGSIKLVGAAAVVCCVLGIAFYWACNCE